MNLTLVSTTYPQPGETQLSPVDIQIAQQLAREHYDGIDQLVHYDGDRQIDAGTYAIKLHSGFAACIGTIEGNPAILHKMPDGTRQLQVYQIA